MRSPKTTAPPRPGLAMVIALAPPVVIAGLLAVVTFGSAARSMRVVGAAGALMVVFLLGHHRPRLRLAAGEDASGRPLPATDQTTDRPGQATPDGGRDIVDEWGRASFPASDPPANW